MFLKRIFDLIAASIGLVVLFPFIVLLVIAVMIDLGWPIFYRAERAGRGGAAFKILKFRSMRPAGPGEQTHHSGEDDPRISRVGKFMRRYKFDELPQLWNVLKGEMSFIGPRPERKHFVDQLRKEIPFYGLRFTVRPGITGWAQVNFRYGASRKDAQRKLEYELFYIQEVSLFLNILILAKTVQTVLLRRGS